ncbi:MAG: response regulator transcription factor [Anaerolineae bacterium]
MESFAKQILVVDDDPDTCALITDILQDDGYSVYPCLSGERAMDALKRRRFDLVLTDIKMPRITGIDLLLHVRRMELDTEVILMTAYASLKTAVQALRGEAFDYLVKPFSLNDLRQRVREALDKEPGAKRASGIAHEKDMTVDLNALRVWIDDDEIELTRQEFKVLAYLMIERGRIVPWEELVEKLWGDEADDRTASTLRSCIRRLRHKLGDDAQNPRYVKNVWGVGYQIGE